MATDNRARDAKIIALRAQGWSYADIGTMVGLTRARISQILAVANGKVGPVGRPARSEDKEWREAVKLLRKGEKVEVCVHNKAQATDLAHMMFRRVDPEDLLNLTIRFVKEESLDRLN